MPIPLFQSPSHIFWSAIIICKYFSIKWKRGRLVGYYYYYWNTWIPECRRSYLDIFPKKNNPKASLHVNCKSHAKHQTNILLYLHFLSYVLCFVFAPGAERSVCSPKCLGMRSHRCKWMANQSETPASHRLFVSQLLFL